MASWYAENTGRDLTRFKKAAQRLVKRAYTREQLERMASRSRFSRWEIAVEGIGFDLCLTKA